MDLVEEAGSVCMPSSMQASVVSQSFKHSRIISGTVSRSFELKYVTISFFYNFKYVGLFILGLRIKRKHSSLGSD